MCDPADLEMGKAEDDAFAHVELKQKLAERARFEADRGLAAEREKAMAAVVKLPEDEARRINETPISRRAPVPSVGRIVHYVAYGSPKGEFPAGVHRAAIITEVVNEGGAASVLDVVHLNVINPTGYFFNLNVPFDPTGETPGSWHWPELV